MEKYLLLAASPPENPKQRRRPPWDRCVVELNGKFPSLYRHMASRLLIDSYVEMGTFVHSLNRIEHLNCPTHLSRLINGTDQDHHTTLKRCGVSGLEFDSKGIYLASVTKPGCISVHDFEMLYTSIYDSCPSVASERSQLLHFSVSHQLDAVRWNPENQDEIACTSKLSNKVLFFDIGYVSSEPVEILEKGRSRFGTHGCEVSNGLSDIKFLLDGKSRLLASDLEGSVYLWDRRLNNLPYLQLTASSKMQLNSVELDRDDRIVYGASENGFIYAWDLRGGRTSFAFQSHNQTYHPLLASVRISSFLEKIPSLKAQSNILPKGIQSISLDPSHPHQLSFHLNDGWSGVLNTNIFDVTHIHCPPPAWLDGMDMTLSFLNLRKPSWLPTSSIYATPSSSGHGIYLLDFYPDTLSACHVDFNEDIESDAEDNDKVMKNKFISLSESVQVCAAHPLNSILVAGTKFSVSSTYGEPAPENVHSKNMDFNFYHAKF